MIDRHRCKKILINPLKFFLSYRVMKTMNIISSVGTLGYKIGLPPAGPVRFYIVTPIFG